MFLARRSLRVTPRSNGPPPSWGQPRRHAATVKAELLKAATPTAEQLAETGIWHWGRWNTGKKKAAKAKGKSAKGDRTKVNIVSEELCDDVISYIQPSLARHFGCDLLDLYPGAGLWSRKLHDVLQPRSHILMEPDAALYTPFLAPLLARPNTTLLAKSGIVWKDLNEVLCRTHLPHQTPRARSDRAPPERNDTLLVTANLAFFPKKRVGGFANMAHLVLYQFVHAIRSGSLFQKYGLVRMLIWAGDDEKHGLVPRALQRRKVTAISTELSTEWVTEVAGADGGDQTWYARDHAIDRESRWRVLRAMAERGVALPPGRKSEAVREIEALGLDGAPAPAAAGEQAVHFVRPYVAELRRLEEAYARGEFGAGSPRHKQLRSLQYVAAWNQRRGSSIQQLIEEADAIARMRPAAAAAGGGRGAADEDEDGDEDGNGAEWRRRLEAWSARVDELNRDMRLQFLLSRDNLHIFRQDPPVLSWDRRALEPLVVRDDEFFPNVPCCLLDIQPKAMHPLLRATGPGTTHSGDVFDLLLHGLMQQPKEPLSKALDGLAPGAADGVLPRCPSLYDPARGGSPLAAVANGELAPRVLNQRQLVEVLDGWMSWPFAPTYAELVGRAADEASEGLVDEESNLPGSHGSE